MFSVDLYDVKEIRAGKDSEDFRKTKDKAADRFNEEHCFVIFYGQHFNLKSLSLAGQFKFTLFEERNWAGIDVMKSSKCLLDAQQFFF